MGTLTRKKGYAAAACTAVLLAASSGAADAGQVRSRTALANGCFAIASKVDGRPALAGPIYFKPTGIGTYMLRNTAGKLLAVDISGVIFTTKAGPAAQWSISRVGKRSFAIAATSSGRRLGVDPRNRALRLVDQPGKRWTRFQFVRRRGCSPYPEATAGATGPTFKGVTRDKKIFGFSDIHLHITADQRAGGNVVYGEPFDPFGIPEALGHDEIDHGADGSGDITGNLLRDGSPVGTHDIHGWPSFTGWPTNDTYTHQQTYYIWLKRMWKAGQRLIVAQTVEDQPLCEIEPTRSHSCNETEAIDQQIQRLYAMQDYIDAQSGGHGRGWFRIVTDPAQARKVMKAGKLAVVIGIESSNLLGCSELAGAPQCSKADIDRGLDEYERLGVRSMFIAHWIDNAFAGAALEGGSKGQFIGAMEVLQTGHPFAIVPCSGADEDGGQCNSKGLTDLGRYLVEQMIARHMLIEVDHLSQQARSAVMAIAEQHHYPLVSSHTGTGGEWTNAQLQQLYALGGVATVRPDTAAAMLNRITELQSLSGGHFYCGVGLGSDTGGFSALPGADAAATPLKYPFRSYDGKVTFTQQQTGERSFDLNRDGVAHYGLFADLIADMQQQPNGRQLLQPFFSSAESYLEMWQRAANTN